MDTKTCGTYITHAPIVMVHTNSPIWYVKFYILIFKALAPVLEYVQPSPEVCAFFSKVKMRQLHVDTVCVYFCVTFIQDDKTSL